MMNKISFITSLIVLSVFLGFSQEAAPETDSKKMKVNVERPYKVKKNKKMADRKLDSGNFYAASEHYEEILKHAPDNTNVQFRLAQAYEASRDYKNAAEQYRKVVESGSVAYPLAKYRLAMMLKMTGQYEKAYELFDELAKKYRGENANDIKRWSRTEAKGCELALSMDNNPAVKVTHLQREVNSPYTDISPLNINDSLLIFSSLPSDTVIVLQPGKPVDYFLKLYQSEKKGGKYAQAEYFPWFNSEGAHTANPAISPKGDRFYFTKCKQDLRTGSILCDIYMSKKEGQIWGDPQILESGINSPKWTSTHPTVAAGKGGTEVLYFASDMPNGRGGMDIWYSLITKSGEHKEPVNLGAKINTDRDEVSPFYDNNTGTLYFSSNGHIGIGGYDVFQSKGESKKWESPDNAGKPLNSPQDDMYYAVDANGKTGYFVSNRVGIFTLKNETCCDDIFHYEFQKIINVAVQGYVYDKADVEKKNPIPNVPVSLGVVNKEKGTEVVTKTDTTGKGTMYFFTLQTEKDYSLGASMKGYLSGKEFANTRGIIKSDTLRVDLFIEKIEQDKIYRLKNIYYDYDKWDLRKESELTLDTLYNLLTSNPTIIIELSSHTDSRGTDNYNLNLSQRRAESCVNYLIKRGIPKERMVAKGYGEGKLLRDCSKEPDCPDDGKSDCPCHQMNRRTEFRIIGELDAELIYEDERYGDEPAVDQQKGKGKTKN